MRAFVHPRISVPFSMSVALCGCGVPLFVYRRVDGTDRRVEETDRRLFALFALFALVLTSLFQNNFTYT